MQKTTRAILWARGLLSVAAAVCAFLLASEEFRKMVPAPVLVGVGCLAIASGTTLSFMDRSLGQHQQSEQPVTVQNAPGETLDVTPKSEESG